MNSSLPSPFSRRSRGSALLTVVIFTTAMAILVASILGWSVNERRLNQRTVYWLEARNAAEALCEYGASQIIYLNSIYDQAPTLDPYGGTTTGNQPLTLPVVSGSTNSFFTPSGAASESHIDTNPLSATDPNGLELVGGQKVQIPSGGALYLIDPNVPENKDDPFIGLQVHRNDYEVLAKATAVPPDGSAPMTAYVKETVSVRGAPLFNYAIFYANNELEIFPGATMVISGPVHVNGDLFINAANNGVTLTFTGPVTTSGSIFHAKMSANTTQSSVDDNNIYFATNATGSTTATMYSGTAGKWDDSTWKTDNGVTGLANLTPLLTKAANTSFATYAAATWPSNVMTSAMGVQTFNPVAFSSAIDTQGDTPDSLPAETHDTDTHVVDPTQSTPTTATGNVGYINDPPDSSLSGISTSNTYYNAKTALEGIKYSNKASLYILVNVSAGTSNTANATADTATITYYGPGNSSNIGTSGYGPNGGVKLGTTANEPANLVSFVPYVKSSGHVTQGLYDQRQGAPIDLVQISMLDLNTALQDVNTGTTTGAIINNNNGGTIWGAGVTSGSLVGLHSNVSDSTAGWNGTVYVDVEGTPIAGTQVSVGLGKGQTASKTTSLIPNTTPATVGTATNIVGSNYLKDNGLTIATNAPVYIEGNFNADGSSATGSANLPDDESAYPFSTPTAEVPVAVVGDTVTLLSPNYFGPSAKFPTGASPLNDSSTGNAYGSSVLPATNPPHGPQSTGSTEVAAAFIAGIVATDQTNSSGGAHNLPRFIEDWSTPGYTNVIRGSLVNMFDSKIATKPYTAHIYYEPPLRKWGYDDLFKSGTFPPNTPESFSMLRIYFNDLSPASYTALRIDSTYGWPSDSTHFTAVQ